MEYLNIEQNPGRNLQSPLQNEDGDDGTKTEGHKITNQADSLRKEPEITHSLPLMYDELSPRTKIEVDQAHSDDLSTQLIASPKKEDLKETEVNKAPDGGWGWWVVIGCTLAHFIIGGFERSGGVILVQFQGKFESGSASTAWIISLSATLRLLLGPLATILSNKFSCKGVVITGGLLFSVGVLISAFMPKLELLYITYGMVVGIGKSFAYAPGLVIVGQYFKKRRSLAVGMATAGGGIGTLLLPPLIVVLFEEYGYRGTFIFLAGFPLHLCICGSLYRPLEVKDKHRKTRCKDKTNDMELVPLRKKEEFEDENCNGQLNSQTRECDVLSSNVAIGSDGKEKHAQLLHTSLKNIKRKFSLKQTEPEKHCHTDSKKLIDLTLLKNSRFLTFCVGICFLSLAFNSVLVFIPPVANSIGLSKLQGAVLLSVAGLFDTLGRFSSGAILNIKKISPFRMAIYNAAMFLLGLITFCLPFMTNFEQFAVVGASYGLLSGTYASQKSVILADILGSENLSSSFGILICFQGIGTLLGPPVTGLLKDLSDDFTDGFYLVGCATLIGALTLASGNIYFYLRDSRKVPKNNKENNSETTC